MTYNGMAVPIWLPSGGEHPTRWLAVNEIHGYTDNEVKLPIVIEPFRIFIDEMVPDNVWGIIVNEREWTFNEPAESSVIINLD